MKRVALIIVGLLVFAALLSCLGIAATPIQVLIGLLFGWIVYVIRVVPRVEMNWTAVLGAALCIATVLGIGHSTAKWLWRSQNHGTDDSAMSRSTWRWRSTVAMVAMITLMFAAGLGATGVAHQAAWLIQSPEKLATRSRLAHRIMCASNLRQIGQAMLLYMNENIGKAPQSFEPLLLTQDITSEVFTCPASDDERAEGETPEAQAARLRTGRHCSYVYYGAGMTASLAPDAVIATEYFTNHGGDGVNILFGDGHVEFFDASAAAKLLRNRLHGSSTPATTTQATSNLDGDATGPSPDVTTR